LKRKKKLFLFVFLIPAFVVIVGFLFLRFGAYAIIDKSDREHLISEIRKSPELPQRFYEIYEVIYPDALKRTTLGSYFENQFSDNFRNECPCEVAAYFGIYRKYFGVKLRLLGFILDDYVTQ